MFMGSNVMSVGYKKPLRLWLFEIQAGHHVTCYMAPKRAVDWAGEPTDEDNTSPSWLS